MTAPQPSRQATRIKPGEAEHLVRQRAYLRPLPPVPSLMAMARTRAALERNVLDVGREAGDRAAKRETRP